MSAKRVALVAAAMWVAGLASAEARITQILRYRQLLDRSDLVVIATPATKTADTAERATLPNIVLQQPDGTQVPIAAVGVETAFDTAAILKGDTAMKRFVLHHYREAQDPGMTLDGPFVLSFDPADPRSWLLFLVREGDGRFAPTGGQTDPGDRSILPLLREPR